MSNITTIPLSSIEIFRLSGSLWGGETALKAADLDPQVRAALPPKELASLGRKRVYPAGPLENLRAIRYRAYMALRRFGCSVFIFFGRPGLRLGLVSAVLSFFGRPGLRFGVWSDAAAIDPFKESGVWVVEVELVIVGVVPSTFNFLGLPRLGFSGTASGSGSGIGATFRLPLFTNVKSGLTW